MREIKFRGRNFETGELIYGDFVHYVPQSTFPGLVDEDGFVHEIFNDSLAQLIGVDKNEEEIYEGDRVIDTLWTEEPETQQISLFARHVAEMNPGKDRSYEASFDDFAGIRDGNVILVKENGI